jgi:hypothetical protein
LLYVICMLKIFVASLEFFIRCYFISFLFVKLIFRKSLLKISISSIYRAIISPQLLIKTEGSAVEALNLIELTNCWTLLFYRFADWRRPYRDYRSLQTWSEDLGCRFFCYGLLCLGHAAAQREVGLLLGIGRLSWHWQDHVTSRDLRWSQDRNGRCGWLRPLRALSPRP